MTVVDVTGAEPVTAPAPVPDDRSRARDRMIVVGTRAVRAVVTLAVILGVWVAFLKVFHVSSFIGKGPLDVWRYLVTNPTAGANRHAIVGESATTLRDAMLGLVGGTVVAIAGALAFTMWKAASSAFLPVAMVLRSVPLVAMTPLIVGVFGRTLLAITVIGGIVTLFPTLVNVSLALRRTPREALELCRAYGASPATTLWKVQIPSAMPSLFASLRIAAPLSLVGALLAEWLATGKGLGYRILTAAAVSDYNGLWSRVVLVTLYSALLYAIVGVIERVVLGRFGAAGR